jgi:hypothetical protein
MPSLLRIQSSKLRDPASPLTRKTSLMRRMARSFRKKPNSDAKFDTLGGVYTTEVCGSAKPSSEHSIGTVDTQWSHSSSSSHESQTNWNSSGSESHHEGAPLIVRKAVKEQHTTAAIPGLELGDEEILGRIMLKSRRLPHNDGYYASNHVMINNERIKRQVPPLKRMRDMDELARVQAQMMATEKSLFHAEPGVIQEQLGRKCGRRIGENVTRGAGLHAIHALMMASLADRNNIMDRRFTCMGVGTAKADDGTLYLCQIFRD